MAGTNSSVASGSQEKRVYAFKNVTLIIDGTPYVPASVFIILRENGIPTARILVDPAHAPGDPGEPATAASLGSLYTNSKRLLKSATDKKPASLTLDVHNKDGLLYALKLTDWVITAAGMTGVSASGAFQMEVELQHPICRTAFCGFNLGSFITDMKVKPGDLPSTDMVAAIAAAVNKYSEIPISNPDMTSAKCNASIPNLSNALQAFKKKLKDASTALTNHLRWDGAYNNACGYNKWPLEICMSDLVDQIVVALQAYVSNGLDSNLWETLVRHICPQWFVSVIPSYWDAKLVLAPYTPWADYKITLTEDLIADINFDGIDPNPLAGVFAQYSAPGLGLDYTVYVPGDSEKANRFEGILYMPVKNPMPGSSVMVAAPAWLEAVAGTSGAAAGAKSSPAKAEGIGIGNVKTPSNTDIDDNIAAQQSGSSSTGYNADRFRGGLYHCAHQTFLTLFRQDVPVTVKCPLLIATAGSTVPDNYVIPGFVCRIMTSPPPASSSGAPIANRATAAPPVSAGTVLYDFYITDVVHNIDCVRGVASTQISGRYPRPEDEFKDIVKNGTCNPVYTN
jgi:hypothetical protein